MIRGFVWTLLLVGFAAALVPAAPAGAATCYASTDSRATEIHLEAETLYVRSYPGDFGVFPRATWVELWREDNAMPGLQRAAGTCTDDTILPADVMHLTFAIPDPSRIS